MKKQINGSLVTFTFDGLTPVVFDAAKASAANRAYAEMHGWQARIGDNAAIARKGADGAIITVTEAMRREAVEELVTFYHGGGDAWAMRAKSAVQNPTILAIAAKRGCTYAEAEAWLAAKALEELDAM